MKKSEDMQLTPNGFLRDADFQAMSAEQRGVYCTLLFLMCCNRGRCKLESLSLGILCGCDDFDGVWEKIKGKFYLVNGYIRPKGAGRGLLRVREGDSDEEEKDPAETPQQKAASGD